MSETPVKEPHLNPLLELYNIIQYNLYIYILLNNNIYIYTCQKEHPLRLLLVIVYESSYLFWESDSGTSGKNPNSICDPNSPAELKWVAGTAVKQWKFDWWFSQENEGVLNGSEWFWYVLAIAVSFWSGQGGYVWLRRGYLLELLGDWIHGHVSVDKKNKI